MVNKYSIFMRGEKTIQCTSYGCEINATAKDTKAWYTHLLSTYAEKRLVSVENQTQNRTASSVWMAETFLIM